MRGNYVFQKYRPINFLNIKSDDRSPEAFKQNIESVTQIKGNVSDKNFKPNLLVIDEIDGASQVKQHFFLNILKFLHHLQAAVQVLVNEINENSKKVKSKEGPTLLRPIICICNDLYVYL
jgi:chromosome transmission fidelity protein 18